MIDLAKSETGIPISKVELDMNYWLLNCLNGTINLKAGELCKHNKNDFITMIAPVDYNPTAQSEIFEKIKMDWWFHKL